MINLSKLEKRNERKETEKKLTWSWKNFNSQISNKNFMPLKLFETHEKLRPTLLDKFNPIWQNWINRKFFIPLGLGADLGFSRVCGGGGGGHFQRDFDQIYIFLYFLSSTRAVKRPCFDKIFCSAGKVLKNNSFFLHFLGNFVQKNWFPLKLSIYWRQRRP